MKHVLANVYYFLLAIYFPHVMYDVIYFCCTVHYSSVYGTHIITGELPRLNVPGSAFSITKVIKLAVNMGGRKTINSLSGAKVKITPEKKKRTKSKHQHIYNAMYCTIKSNGYLDSWV